MEGQSIHELTAAYALDALDEGEQREFEEHLRGCGPCRREVAELAEAAAALAYGVEAPSPPADLRTRVLARAREERGRVLPLRARTAVLAAAAGVAAAAAAIAVGLGLWAGSISQELDEQRQTSEVLAAPSSRTVALAGADGRLVVAPDGTAVLVTEGLRRPPEGRTYAIWVINGQTPRPAGLFDGGDAVEVVRLTRPVPRGAEVAVTVEQAGGVDRPTGRAVLTASA